jgi:hypothetical protein
VVGGSKEKVQGPFFTHVGPLIGLLCFGNCVFFFFLVSQLLESVCLGIGFDNIFVT